MRRLLTAVLVTVVTAATVAAGVLYLLGYTPPQPPSAPLGAHWQPLPPRVLDGPIPHTCPPPPPPPPTCAPCPAVPTLPSCPPCLSSAEACYASEDEDEDEGPPSSSLPKLPNAAVQPRVRCPGARQARPGEQVAWPWLWPAADGTIGTEGAPLCRTPDAHALPPTRARRAFAAFAADANSLGLCYVRALNLMAVRRGPSGAAPAWGSVCGPDAQRARRVWACAQVNSTYGLVCFTLATNASAEALAALARVHVDVVVLPPFTAAPAELLADLPLNWQLSFHRLGMLGAAAGAYDLLAYLDADVVLVDRADELVEVGGVDLLLTPETDNPCVAAFPHGVNAGVVVFRPSVALLRAVEAFARDSAAVRDATVFRTSDQSLLAWFLRRRYPGAHAFAASAATVRDGKLGKERVLFASASYNMPPGACACNSSNPEQFSSSVWPFVKVWHFNQPKPYLWTENISVPGGQQCFCPLLRLYQQWMHTAGVCSNGHLRTSMVGYLHTRKATRTKRRRGT
jgi:hypothetical protein